ncbi:MAG: hypothetical protein F2881_10120 [Actinobacteria bacterium]|uniref:Unannotated protein n=1 Tax=freshwater metagenome TaxID=449393 RepID=A0A6J7R9N1_9ZZZZ|nr:hypothetical protein [Actinomycetota bacterium]
MNAIDVSRQVPTRRLLFAAAVVCAVAALVLYATALSRAVGVVLVGLVLVLVISALIYPTMGSTGRRVIAALLLALVGTLAVLGLATLIYAKLLTSDTSV